jgi:hypothetical protein
MQAEKFHACALEIQRTYREYTSREKKLNDDQVKEYTIRYDDILLKYNINHSKYDHLKVKISLEGVQCKNKIFYYIGSFFANYFIPIILMFGPIFIGILIITQRL